MKRKIAPKKPTKKEPVDTTVIHQQLEELALQLFTEYANGTADILLINKSQNLLFLNDYQYTLQLLHANNSPSERAMSLLEHDYKNGL